jgi:EpsD family peptidyl-prolyl cis-trans isomerase
MSKLSSVSLIALTSLSLMMTACQKKAEGQVVAVVNGEEITLNELNSELGDLNLPANVNKEAVRAEVLQKMIDRRLLAQAAKEEGLDRDPTYISQERRMKERLLVGMYGKKAMDTIEVPNAAKIDQFMAGHPGMFSGRTRLMLDQLQFDAPADMSRLKELESAHSLQAVGEKLTQMGIKFQQGKGALDSATVPPEVLQKIQALPAGEPFVVPNGGKVVVSVVTGTQPVALPTEQARPLAVQAMRAEELNKIGEQRLAEAKAKAKIDYQPGFSPPAKKADPKAPGALQEATTALPTPAAN